MLQLIVDSSLRRGRPAIGLAALVAGPSLAAWLLAAVVRLPDLYNDFHSYWYAGRLLIEGASPYDLGALRDLAARHGDVFVLGTGYSYPLPFAIAMVPLAMMPFDIALALFNLGSIGLFAATVAIWLGRVHPSALPGRRRLAALACGALPPVVGSVLNGQVNLLVTATLAAGIALVLDRARTRSGIGGAAIGLAAVVKLVPGVLAVPLALAGNRRAAAIGVVGAFVGSLGLAALVRPAAAADAAWLAELIRPDPFVTNQSVNGFVTRFFLSTDRMTAPAPGALDPVPAIAILTLALAAATLGVLWRARDRLATGDGLALGLALSLAAATAGAPKTSFWNGMLLLVSVGLIVATLAPRLDGSGLDLVERTCLLGWLVSAFGQPLIWIAGPVATAPGDVVIAILSSIGLYGNLALCWLLGRRLLRSARVAEDRPVQGQLRPSAT